MISKLQKKLYLIEILHQTTTSLNSILHWFCCILLKFYIKPQLSQWFPEYPCVVSYWNSTSNHNYNLPPPEYSELYLIEILHQTTTPPYGTPNAPCCILLKFYIKPQQDFASGLRWMVVSYWNSTSNHNLLYVIHQIISVVSYWNSTSNHNKASGVTAFNALYLIEILHQTTTTETVGTIDTRLYLIEILHQTTTTYGVRLSGQ